MERDYPVLAFKAAVGCLLLAILLILFVVFAPLVVGDNELVKTMTPVAAMLIVILGGLLALLANLLLICEVAVSKNDGGWKALWIIVMVVLGILGAVIYLSVARKDLKR